MCIPYIKYCTLNFKTGKTVRGAVPRRHRLVSGCKSNIGGKTLRDRYGQNATGPVRAKRYGTGTGKTLRGPYGLRFRRCTGYGVGAVRGPHLSPCEARTGNVQGPFGCPYHLLLGLPLPCPYGHVYWDSSD